MITTRNISKSFQTNDTSTRVLNSISLEIDQGEFVSIVGRSGSGKTTLLNILSTLVHPSEGELLYQGKILSNQKDATLNKLRQTDFSIIFQFHHLLPYLTILENTMLPFLRTMKPAAKKLQESAINCLERVNLADKKDRLPGNLSGGEQQRVAIARALVKSSKVLFADEPTGSLDKGTGQKIMELLTELNQENLTVVMVTHDPEYAALASRTITLEDGLILS